MSSKAQLNTQPDTKSPDYNSIAAFYQKHWCAHYHTGLLAMLDGLLLARLAAGARVLDVCCGTGTLAKHLAGRGFSVTGVDASRGMLTYAKEQVPTADFFVADARAFTVPPVFDGALCTFDSLSYILEREDLDLVFSNIFGALRPGGIFVFDLSLEAAYKGEWQNSCSIVEENEACFIRGSYDEGERRGQTLITMFHQNGGWERTDIVFHSRCHRPEEVLHSLQSAGFSESVCHLSDDDQVLKHDLGPGRGCFVATR